MKSIKTNQTKHLTAEAVLDKIYLFALSLAMENEIDFSNVEVELEIAKEGKTLRRSFSDALQMQLEVRKFQNV